MYSKEINLFPDKCRGLRYRFNFMYKAHKTPIDMGKTMAARMPSFRESPKAEETSPARVGPPAQPTSPASARNENIIVPPVGKPAEAKENVPGQNIPTEKPTSPHPIKDIKGMGDMTTII